MKKLIIQLEIEVVELSEEEQKQCIKEVQGLADLEEGEEGEVNDNEELVDDLGFSPDDYDPFEFNDIVKGMFYPDAVREMFAGSNMYVTFGEVTVTDSKWKGE